MRDNSQLPIVLSLGCLLAIASSCLAESNAVSFESLRVTPTCYAIGIEWDVAGDTNHNAECEVRFRRAGSERWRNAMPLIRMDYKGYYGKQEVDKRANMLAGSILFLTPGTDYEVRLTATDPDGGELSKVITASTRPLPSLALGGRVLHVKLGAVGGNGSKAKPFGGTQAAQDAAQPGDTVLLHAGRYGHLEINRDGEPDGRYILWRAAENAAVQFDTLRIKASHIWLDGVRVINEPKAKTGGIYAPGSSRNCVLTNNRIEGYNYGITLNPNCRNWFISDNEIIGDKTLTEADNENFEQKLTGEGIELGKSGGHTVCYNRISRVADGVSYPAGDTDIFANDIMNVTDDGLEPDYGFANIRMWGNRVTGFGEAGISFQPMNCGPWYIIRNQFVGSQEPHTDRIPKLFKFRVLDRFVMVNNTFVTPASIGQYSDCLFLAICKNNLFISSTGATQLWVGVRHEGSIASRTVVPLQEPTSFTQVDFNGYDWGDKVANGFRYQSNLVSGEFVKDLSTFAEAAGVEANGLRVRKEDIFAQWSIPAGVGRADPYGLLLSEKGKAIDAGVMLPNIAEAFNGQAPDLGAFEYDAEVPTVGPRKRSLQIDVGYWAKF